MPSFDISEAKRELLSAAEPIELIFQGKSYKFPGIMPAEVEIEQMAIQREIRDKPADAPAPEGSEERLIRAAFGSSVYDELEREVPISELMIGLNILMQSWMSAYQDPNLSSRLKQQTELRIKGGSNSNGSSSSTSRSSKRTSSGSTTSTSPKLSTVPNGSREEGSAPSIAASRQKR